MKKIVGSIIIAILLVSLSIVVNSVSAQKEVWVDDDFNRSTPGWGTTHFNSIEDGINNVDTNGTVYVAAGMYNENLIINKSLWIVGEGSDITIIDGNCRVINNKKTVRISGVTIRNDTATYDRCIYNDGKLTLMDCVVTNNDGSEGGGIYNNGNLTMTNCTVSGNTTAGDGGGICNWCYSTLIIRHCIISNNTAGDEGGGIQNRGHSTLVIEDSIIENN